MTEENRTYITHLKVTDVPWHRLTTAYGRGTDFPAHLTVLEQMRDLASVKESLYELTTNMEHQSTLWHATPFGMVFLSRILEKALADSGQNMDCTTILDGYYADASRMFIIGKTTPKKEKLVQVARECLEIGMEAAKPDVYKRQTIYNPYQSG